MALPDDVITILGAVTGGTAMATSTAACKRRVNETEAYLLSKGYNPRRQKQIEIATHSELEQMAGRKVGEDYYDTKMAITEVLKKEGIKYCDTFELQKKDPYYRMYAGIKTTPGDVTFADLKKQMTTKERKAYREAGFAVFLVIFGGMAILAIVAILLNLLADLVNRI